MVLGVELITEFKQFAAQAPSTPNPGRSPAMNADDLIAIDIHTHAEVSCWNPFDNYGEEYDRAADKYFGSNRRPTIA